MFIGNVNVWTIFVNLKYPRAAKDIYINHISLNFCLMLLCLKLTFDHFLFFKWTLLWKSTTHGSPPNQPLWLLWMPKWSTMYCCAAGTSLPLPGRFCWPEVWETHYCQFCWEGFLRWASTSQNSSSSKHLTSSKLCR